MVVRLSALRLPSFEGEANDSYPFVPMTRMQAHREKAVAYPPRGAGAGGR
jgi:hypothetical protein